MFHEVLAFGQAIEFVSKPLQVGDGLFKDMAQDIDVDDLGTTVIVCIIYRLLQRPVIIGR